MTVAAVVGPGQPDFQAVSDLSDVRQVMVDQGYM